MFSMIVALDQKTRGIGVEGNLLFNIKEDLERFKNITMGKTILMGRKTFESLPGVLPGRKHIVITRDRSYKVNNPDVEVWNDITSIVACFMYGNEENVIIGGGEIYKTFLPFADKIYVTETTGFVPENVVPDTHFPELDKHWEVTESETSPESKPGKEITYKTYVRK